LGGAAGGVDDVDLTAGVRVLGGELGNERSAEVGLAQEPLLGHEVLTLIKLLVVQDFGGRRCVFHGNQ
jgi:hypothetical protein